MPRGVALIPVDVVPDEIRVPATRSTWHQQPCTARVIRTEAGETRLPRSGACEQSSAVASGARALQRGRSTLSIPSVMKIHLHAAPAGLRSGFVRLAGIVVVPVLLVILQGDLGTALMYFPILAGMMLVAGLKPRFMIGVLILVVLVAPIGWFSLKGYQKQRIMVTLNPELDPKGIGYQTRQSQIAIGSGGFFGTGIGNGLQSQLGFVPEVHTDFIFSLLAEETGLVGAFIVLMLYLFVLLRLLLIAEKARDRAGILIMTGIASLMFFHVAINVGMTLGMVPAIGIPLPLLSYGGSSAVSTYVALGLALNVHFRRFVY